MIPEDYLESKTVLASSLNNTDVLVILEEDAYEAVDMAKRQIAREVHKLICKGNTISEIDKWVTGICDF